MSVTLTGTGGLFTRLGRIFRGIASANKFSDADDISPGGLEALGTIYTDILAQYASSQQDLMNGLFTTIDSSRTSLAQFKSDMARLAESTLIEQVHADAVLTEKTKLGAMRELIDQMIGAGSIYNADNDVDANTVSVSVSADAGNTGSGTVIASVVGPDGRNREYVFPETIEVIVSTDVAAGGTARAETATVKGEHPVGDPLAYNWPAGSGASTTIVATDAVLDNSRNLLTNSDFEDFTSNTPDNWTVLVGEAGTDILKETTVVYRGTNSLEFIGTGGSPLSSVAQIFNDDTEGELEPNTVYAVALLMRKSASLAAGNIQIRLLDGSNNVIADDAGTDNTISVAHGAIDDAAFGWHGGFFRTPKTLVPGTTVHKFNIRVSTALTSGESVYIADAACVEATEVYPGGPFIGMFAGDDDFLVGDKFEVTVSNNRAGEMQDWFERVFGMRALGLQLPSNTTANAETIADSLVSPTGLVETLDIVAGFVPLDLQTARDGDWVAVGDHLTIILFTGAGTDGDDAVISLEQAQDGSGTGAAALNFTEIWRKQGADLTAITSFTKTTQAASDSYTNTDAHQEKIWVLEIPASQLSSGMTHVRASIADVGTNAQLGCVLYFKRPL